MLVFSLVRCNHINRICLFFQYLRLDCRSGQGTTVSLFPIRFSGDAVVAGSDATSNPVFIQRWIASQSLSSGGHSRDPLARDIGIGPRKQKTMAGVKPRFSRPGDASSPDAVMLGLMPAGNSCVPAS
jgi:hypothetical protein